MGIGVCVRIEDAPQGKEVPLGFSFKQPKKGNLDKAQTPPDIHPFGGPKRVPTPIFVIGQYNLFGGPWPCFCQRVDRAARSHLRCGAPSCRLVREMLSARAEVGRSLARVVLQPGPGVERLFAGRWKGGPQKIPKDHQPLVRVTHEVCTGYVCNWNCWSLVAPMFGICWWFMRKCLVMLGGNVARKTSDSRGHGANMSMH